MDRAKLLQAYLAADNKLGQAQARHRHWRSALTADHLKAAQSRARLAYAAYLAAK